MSDHEPTEVYDTQLLPTAAFIEISGLEILPDGIFGYDDDDPDDSSCDSYCADSIPHHEILSDDVNLYISTTSQKPHCFRKAMTYSRKPVVNIKPSKRIFLRRSSLASQLTDEENSIASNTDSIDSDNEYKVSPTTGIHVSKPTITRVSADKNECGDSSNSNDSNFPDFAEDSVCLAAMRAKHVVRTFSQKVSLDVPALHHSEAGRAA